YGSRTPRRRTRSRNGRSAPTVGCYPRAALVLTIRRDDAGMKVLLVRRVAVLGREIQVGQLLGEPEGGTPTGDVLQVREVGLDAAAEAGQALAVGQPQLGGQVVVIKQADLVDPAGQRLRGLDLDPPVALQPGGGRNQLADD